MTNITKSYAELITIPTFEERLAYLQLNGKVGSETFGQYRYLIEKFYSSREWKLIKRDIIIRDMGRDLACPGYELGDIPIVVHHINFLTIDDYFSNSPKLRDPNNLITTTHETHMLIHYGINRPKRPHTLERVPGDTTLWTPIKRMEE